MTNILFGTAIGIAMSVAILGAYRWLLWHGHMLRPSQEVRDLVDEYARLKAEFRHVNTERGEGCDIWDRMGAIDLELIELGYCLQETPTAAYVFPIDNYYVKTFAKGDTTAGSCGTTGTKTKGTSRVMFKLTVDVAEDGPRLVEIEKNACLLSRKLGCIVAVRFPVANGNTLNVIHNGKNSAEFLDEWCRLTCASNFTKNGILSCSSLDCKFRAACRRGQGLTASGAAQNERTKE